jgi:hypothetical protein
MSVLRYRSYTAWLNDQDVLKRRRQQLQQSSVIYANEGEEITRIQKLTVGELLGLKLKNMSL